MDKNSSYKIIKDTFEGGFDKNRFLLFSKNLLNTIDESKAFQLSSQYIPESFRAYIKSYERLGTYTDPEDKKIDVLVVYLQRETTLERARTAQRNFIARYLKDRDQKDAGLVAFVSPNSEDWRFSLIKMEYKFTEGKTGTVKVKEEFTPARRWSFLVGANENSHTAKSRLAPILQDDEHNPSLKFLEEAFNIEKVTKEFFEKYRDLFLRVKETLDDVVKKDSLIKRDFTENGVDTVEFAKKLLGQIVFLYFLQKKGWFGVERDGDWGSGPRGFLRQLFEKKHSEYKNFFNDILEPLFYEALARERDDDFYSRFNCKIPFLNGGLFDPINNYDWVHTDILLPDDLFSNKRKTSEGDIGDGILDIFDRYNFTVKEDEPLEKEVAVDPETLGKVFENLLEVKDRKSKGTYYTPREIVHYMCVQSLTCYLATELKDKVSKEDLEKLIKYGETVGEHDARVEEKGEETVAYSYKMPENVRLNAKLIDNKLSNIKVCDPAIGSGAFPVGMMTEIVRARNTLSSYLKGPERTLYNFKRDCIQNSLYGVDVDPGAVEIAKLRLWLSLVVDEDDIKQIKPLPNLDYKIMQGNSLLEEFEGIKLFDEKLVSDINFDKEKQIENLKDRQSKLQNEYIRLHQANKLTNTKKVEYTEELKSLSIQIKRLGQSGKMAVEDAGLFDIYGTAKKKADELKKLHKEFFETTHKKRKDELKKHIEELEWDLIEATLKEQDKHLELKKLEEFKRANTKPFFLWKLHFAEIFQNGGFDVVIANPPYSLDLEESYKQVLKKTFSLLHFKINLFACFIEKGFQMICPSGVITFIVPNLLFANDSLKILRKHILENLSLQQVLNLGDGMFEEVTMPTMVFVIKNESNLNAETKVFPCVDKISDVNNFFIIPQSDYKKNFNYIFDTINPRLKHLIGKIESVSVPVDQVLDVNQGVITGDDKLYVSNKATSLTWKKCIRGRDIDKFVTKDPSLFVLYDRKKLACPRSEDIFNCPEKLLLRRTADLPIATYDDQQYYNLHTLYSCRVKDADFDVMYLLGIINSNILKFLYQQKLGTETGRTFAEIKILYIRQLPIKKALRNEQKPIIDMVIKILQITKRKDYQDNSSKQAEVYDCVKRLDQMIYKLYGLTQAEIEMIEKS